jgi:long-subunit acyl-CoA synthetase (AMP-forming)
MSPSNIEAALKGGSPLIGVAVAIGDGRPYNTALIVLDPDAALAFATEHGDGAIAAEVAAGVERANAVLARVEQLKKHTIVPGEWLPGGEELTPTLKLKRKPIAEKYAADIEGMY